MHGNDVPTVARKVKADVVDFALIRNLAFRQAEALVKAWLPGGRREGDEWVARNPTRADEHPGSFKVNLRTGEWADFATNDKGGDLIALYAYLNAVTQLEAARRIAAELGIEGEATAERGRGPGKPTIVGLYDYTDDQGTLLFQTVRLLPKDFRQRRPDGKGGWIWNLDGVQRVPYRLPELIEAIACDRPVFIPEGEKDVDNLALLGVTATCNSEGAGKWRLDHARYLTGADVIILPDNDKRGSDHAKVVAAALTGVARRVRVLALPGLPEKGDVSDWLAAGGTADELWHLASTAPELAEWVACEGWPEPEPLITEAEELAYPVDALPGVIRKAVLEVHEFVQAPLSLVAASALSALSLSCQGLADIRRASNLEGPVSLNLITIAASGERKSTADRLFTKAIHQFQTEQQAAIAADLTRYRAQMAGWEAKREGIKLAIKEATKKGRDTLELEVDLEEHEKKKPVKPLVAQLLPGDSTMEAMAWHMAQEWPSLGIIDAEAGAVFGAHSMASDAIMRFLAFLNKMWDGSSHRHNRRSSEPFTAQGRLTVALLLQGEVLADFFAKNGALARGIGFFARFLVAHPRSTQGQRPFAEPPHSWPALEAFNSRILKLLNTPLAFNEAGKLTPPVLGLDGAAKALWIEQFNRIEAGLGAGGPFCDVQDIASKAADNVARLAALFHIFDHGSAGSVGEGAMRSAGRIIDWHLNEARRFFGLFVAPAEVAEAAALDRWLIEQCRRDGTRAIPRRIARQFAPRSVRGRKELDQALTELAELGRARMAADGRKLIEVNPRLLATR